MTLYAQHAQSSAKRVAADYAQWVAKKDLVGELQQVFGARNARLAQVVRECWQLWRAPGRLSLVEYLRYRLYRPGLDTHEKLAFLSDRIHLPVCNACSSPYWRAATEDKWLSYAILEAAGIPVPDTVAVYDPSLRTYGKVPVLREAADLGTFLAQSADFPLFVKPNDQIASFGVCLLQAFQNGRAVLHDGTALTAQEIIGDIFGKSAFLLQKRIENHPDLSVLTPHLATLRLVNFVRESDVFTPFAVLKIPAAKNIADNFWRPGNMLADVDARSGVIRRVVRGTGIDQVDVSDGVGLQLPLWQGVQELNAKVARLFAPVAFNSLDIGITPGGPVVVEINSGSSFDLVQVASGRGFLISEVADFFKRRGWPAKDKRRS